MFEPDSERHADPRLPDLEAIEIKVDKDGSPVTLEEGSWFICFVPGLRFVHAGRVRGPAGSAQAVLHEVRP